MAHERAADDLVRFWETARSRAGLGKIAVVTGSTPALMVPPPAWSFGAEPAEADELLGLVLAGTKTATASAAWRYEAADESLPTKGDLGIVLDGAGRPSALVRTEEVRVVGFDRVDAEHAAAEGEGDRTLEHWRAAHEDFFTRELEHAGRQFDHAMPVVLERLKLLYPRPGSAGDRGGPTT